MKHLVRIRAVMDCPEDLVRLCSMARVMGLDLATIWRTILRFHPLVAAAPIQATGHTFAEMLLTTGDRLIIDLGGAFRLRPADATLCALDLSDDGEDVVDFGK